ncbi:MAG: hypothetical protein GY750_04905 [Lentisphaerae bacterium]|nr:hypothetical protein [bacterium]MCP4100752.1 hypothetical protein [Lentisphaerota bacterium]
MSNESQYNEAKLKVTSIYSIKESKGSALGLEGNQSLYIVGAAIIAFLFCFIGIGQNWNAMTLVVALVTPFCLVIIYLGIFHIKKPPGYQFDLFSKIYNGSDFDIRTKEHKENPYLKLQKGSNG